MVLNEAPEKPLARPKGFPTCTNFYDDHSRDIDYTEPLVDNHLPAEKETFEQKMSTENICKCFIPISNVMDFASGKR